MFLRQLISELPAEFAATPFTESGLARVTYAGRDIAVILPDAEPNAVYFRTKVGSAAGCGRMTLAQALLRGNAFWQGAAGGALSLKDGVVYLTDRRTQDSFDDAEGLGAYLENLTAAAILWNERLATFRGKEA